MYCGTNEMGAQDDVIVPAMGWRLDTAMGLGMGCLPEKVVHVARSGVANVARCSVVCGGVVTMSGVI